MTTTAEKNQQLKELSDSVFNYMSMHSTSVEMNTKYVLGGVTLARDTSKMVLVYDSIRASGTHIDYQSFLRADKREMQENQKFGPHFQYLEHTKKEDPMSLISTRYMDEVYKEMMPIFSDDTTRLIIRRLKTEKFRVNGSVQTEEDLDIIDVYDCSKESFWTSKEVIDPSIGEYMLSLKLQKGQMENLTSIKININRFVTVNIFSCIEIYDIEAENWTEAVNMNKPQSIRLLERCKSLNIESAENTYDRVSGVIVNPKDLGQSWVFLGSPSYHKIHMVRVQDFKNHIKQRKEERAKERAEKTLGGNFIHNQHSNDHHLFSVTERTFSSPTYLCVSANLTKAVLKTVDETWVINLESDGSKQKITSMPFLRGKNFTVLALEEDFLFCEKQEDKLSVQFSQIEMKNAKDFSNTELHINSPDYKIVEAIEIKTGDEPCFRVSYIDGSEIFNCIEIYGTAQGQKFVKLGGSTQMSTIRWPFIAYVNDPWTIVITSVAKPDCYIYFNVQEDLHLGSTKTIRQIQFTGEGNLIFLVADETESVETYYRLKVKSQSIKFHENYLGKSEATFTASKVNEETSSHINSGVASPKYCEKICSQAQKKVDADRIIVFEQTLGHKNILTIVERRHMEPMRIIVATAEDKATDDKADFQVKLTEESAYKMHSIKTIAQNDYIVREGERDVLRHLEIDYNGVSNYEDTQLYEATGAQKIVDYNCSFRNIYLLLSSRDNKNFTFESYSVKAGSKQLNATGVIKNVQNINYSFINEFQRCETVMENIFIANDLKFVKYYPEVEGAEANLQNYFNYLPIPKEKHSERKLRVSSIATCRTSRRILMQFSYSKSRLPKLAIISPYFGTRQVRLARKGTEDVVTWASNIEIKQRIFQQSLMKKIMNSSKTAAMNFNNAIVANRLKRFQTHIFRYEPKNFLLQEYDLAGVIKKQTSFADRFKGYHILAIGDNKLTYLVTPEGNEYLEVLKIRQIDENHVCTRNEINTKEIDVHMENGTRKLFDILYDMSTLNCKFDFHLNDDNLHMLIDCYTQDDNIIGLFYMNMAEKIARQIIAEDQPKNTEKTQQNLFESLFAQEIPEAKHGEDQAKVYDNRMANLKQISKSFLFSQNCEIDSNQVIIYSKKNIMYASISNYDRDTSKEPIKLKTCKFQLGNKDQVDQTNPEKRIHKRQTQTERNSRGTEDEDFDEIIQGLAGDVIEDILARNTPDIDEAGVKTDEGKYVVIKIREKNRSFLMFYDLARDEECSSLQVSRKAQIFYSCDNQAMVCDPEQGIINIETKEILHEFQIPEYSNGDLGVTNMAHSTKMIQNDFANYFITASTVVMPYSLLGVIQKNQPPQIDFKAERFYTSDYYKIQGKTTMHKFMKQPVLLNKIIDCYSEENNLFLTSLLVQEVTDYSRQEVQTASLHRTMNMKVTTKMGKDVVDTQIDIKNDEVLNKILFHLSKISYQYTFKHMVPKMSELVSHKRFADYFSGFLRSTDQMSSVQIMFTSFKPGETERTTFPTRYLGYQFFKDHPQEKESVSQQKPNQVPEFDDQHDDDFRRVRESSKTEESTGPKLSQVRVSYTNFNWLFDENGRKFIDALVLEDDCFHLLKLKTTQEIFGYMWEQCASTIIRKTFLPFCFLILAPLIVMAILINSIEDKEVTPFQYFIYYFAVFLFGIGIIQMTHEEVIEMIKTERSYIGAFRNWFQIIFITACLALIIQILIHSDFLFEKVGDKQLEHIADGQRVKLIIVFQLAVMEFCERVKIFDFFAYFVRQLKEIMKDSAPLAAMFGFLVVAQALLYWILDQNSKEQSYLGIYGFIESVLDSFRLSIGDSENIGNAFTEEEGTTEYLWLFQLIFIVGTVLQVLIILNMVIAVMSSTFARVEADTEAHILRERISLLADFLDQGRFSKKHLDQLKQDPYLLSIEIDPVVDPMAEDNQENRLKQRIDQLEKSIKADDTEENHLKDRIDQLDKNIQTQFKDIQTQFGIQFEIISKHLNIVQDK